MASSSSSKGQSEFDAEITLDFEEFGGLSLDVEEEEEEYNVRWCLIGRFLNAGIIDVQAMVIRNSPWTFERKQLIFEQLKARDNPRSIPLNRLDLWIQIHDLQHGFRTERTLQMIGNYIGKFIESDENNFSSVWREYFKIRVTINLDQPLQRRMKIHRLDSSDLFWVNFKYEHAPTFCVIWGIISHVDKSCPNIFKIPEEYIVKPYGAFMRATIQWQNKLIGSQWLRYGRTDKGDRNEGLRFHSVAKNGGPTTAPELARNTDQLMAHNDGDHGQGVNSEIKEPIMVQKLGPNFEENLEGNIDINMGNHIDVDMQ
uniref:Zinc knuckle CX2CX4HX4C domain-containing protein n=1 Tax=Cannabis sativa TaxID=3483 RepID=A0A803QDX5_CANSA